MDRGDIGNTQQVYEAFHTLHTNLGTTRVVEVRAPRHDPHAEGTGQVRHDRAQPAQSDQAKCQPFQIPTSLGLPSSASERVDVGQQVARGRKDQGHCKMRGRGRPTGGAADRDTVCRGGGGVDGKVAHSGGHEQTQVGKRLDQCRRERGAFTHHAQNVERGECVDKAVFGDRVGEDRHFGAKIAPVRKAMGISQVIVEYSNFHGSCVSWSGNSIVSSKALRLLPWGSMASERATPPDNASWMTKFRACSLGKAYRVTAPAPSCAKVASTRAAVRSRSRRVHPS